MAGSIVSATYNPKLMAGGHAVHEQQAILSTTVVISHTFCMENEKELTPRGAWDLCDPIMHYECVNYTDF